MNVSSRTPGGASNHCPVCNSDIRVEPSALFGDATCPNCGCLLWFVNVDSTTRIYRRSESERFRERVEEFCAQQLGEVPESIGDDRTLECVVGADSLGTVELVLALEEDTRLQGIANKDEVERADKDVMRSAHGSPESCRFVGDDVCMHGTGDSFSGSSAVRKRRRMIAWLFAVITILIAGSVAIPIFVYLPLHAFRYMLSAGILVAGVVAAAVVFRVTSSPRRGSWSVWTVGAVLVVLLALPFVSTALHRVTYSRFGMTVYGVLPIPFLDVTIDRNGLLGFRDKTHRITRNEIDRLITPDVEIVVVGVGWDSAAQVDPDVFAPRNGSDVEIKVLPTPDAFKLYNALVAQGRVVVLLAHSTC